MKRAEKKIEQQETLSCYIKYKGPEVDNGEMDVKKLAPSLLAFNNSINKIYKDITNDKSSYCNTYVKVVEKGSVGIGLDVIGAVLVSAGQMGAITLIKSAFEELIAQINLKQFLKGEPPKEVTPINGSKFEIKNINNSTINVDARTYNIYDKKIISKDLRDLTEPLGDGIQEVSISSTDGNSNLTKSIASEEKDFFSVIEVNTEIDITTEGIIRRMDKETGNIWFIRGETKISCNPSNKIVKDKCISLFGSRQVRITGRAITSPKGQILRINIIDIEEIQPMMSSLNDNKKVN
jgi:hypothetical protein